MSAPRVALCVVALAQALALLACREDSTAPEILEPPSLLRATVPVDSTENIFGPTDFSMTFRRSVSEHDIAVQVYPGPLSAGPLILSPTGRTLTWFDVELDRHRKAYRFLIDGPSMAFPETVELFPGSYPAVSGRMGGCLSLTQPGADLSEVVVFALLPGEFDTSTDALPRLFRGQHPEMITKTGLQPGGCDTFYFFTYLELVPHVIIGVLDTSGDGRYDLSDDWWGYRGTDYAATAVMPSASVVDVPMDLDLSIGPPR